MCGYMRAQLAGKLLKCSYQCSAIRQGLSLGLVSDFYLQHQSGRACKSAFIEKFEKSETNLLIRTNISLFYES